MKDSHSEMIYITLNFVLSKDYNNMHAGDMIRISNKLTNFRIII